MKAVIEVDRAAAQICQARWVQEHGHTFALQLRIVGLRLIERHAVLKAGATARFDEHPELFLRRVQIRVHGTDPIGGTRRKCNHAVTVKQRTVLSIIAQLR